MTLSPIPMVYAGGDTFRVSPRFIPKVIEHFGEGEVVLMAQVEERTEVSHNHEFAWLRDAWATLPESIADDYPSPEHLRKRALIATGWATMRDYVCASRAEATRLAATLKSELDAYALIIASESVVRVCRAKSQSRKAMNKADFQASKEAVLRWVADLIGSTPEQVSPAAQEPGGVKSPARVAA